MLKFVYNGWGKSRAQYENFELWVAAYTTHSPQGIIDELERMCELSRPAVVVVQVDA